MILINTNTNQAYSNVSKAEAARMMLVNVRTVYRWVVEKQYTIVKFKHWELYPNEKKLKVNQGNKKANVNTTR